MSEPKKRRTSRKRTSKSERAGKIVDSTGTINAEPGSSVTGAILNGAVLHVGRGAVVDDGLIVRHKFPGGLVIEVKEGAVVKYVDIEQQHPSEPTPLSIRVVIGAGAILQTVSMYLSGDPEHGLPLGFSVGAGAEIAETVVYGAAVIGARAIVLRSEMRDTTIGDDTKVEDCNFRGGSFIGSRCNLDTLKSQSTIAVGDDVIVIEGREVHCDAIGNRTTISNAAIGMGTKIGSGCRIDNSLILYSVTIGNDVTLEAEHVPGEVPTRYVSIGGDSKIGNSVHIGAFTFIKEQVKIGDGAKIGKRVQIEKYAIIDPGVVIGDGSIIRSGVRVRGSVADDTIVESAAGSLPPVTVHASAESWMLGRVADVMESAGQKRLDKRVLAKELPTLVETHCVKQLLRLAPPPDVQTLREMAKQFSCTPKYVGETKKFPPYVASVTPRGWSGMQVMGNYDNDVIIFRTTPEVLESVVPGWIAAQTAGENDPHPWQVGFLNALMILGKTNSHPGGEDPYVIGWARVKFDEAESAVLCEELQTDLALLAWDPSSEIWHLSDDAGPNTGGTRSIHGFVISQEIARLLTTEGIVPSLWEQYVRALPSAIGQRRFVMPTFTKDKAAQQKAIMALAFWNAADTPVGSRDHGRRHREYHPTLYDMDLKKFHTVRVYRWVAVGMLGRWLSFSQEHPKTSVIFDPDIRPAVERALREWPVEAAKIVDDVRGLFGDFYESALAGVLQLARKAGMKEVWVPDYETKYAIASYGGSDMSEPLEPPRSVYTDLPKKFGVTQVEPLPSYMDTGMWRGEAAERRRETWPRVKIPDHPRGRRLLTNAKVR